MNGDVPLLSLGPSADGKSYASVLHGVEFGLKAEPEARRVFEEVRRITASMTKVPDLLGIGKSLGGRSGLSYLRHRAILGRVRDRREGGVQPVADDYSIWSRFLGPQRCNFRLREATLD
jgi:hypothetical protein